MKFHEVTSSRKLIIIICLRIRAELVLALFKLKWRKFHLKTGSCGCCCIQWLTKKTLKYAGRDPEILNNYKHEETNEEERPGYYISA